MSYHVPVLLEESVEGLNIKRDGIYVDVTFGGGGHSKKILEKLDGGRLLAFDQDEDAKENAKAIDSSSFTFIESNFRHLSRYLKFNKAEKVDGVLADLGVSSHQIDSTERGFSTRFEADLDMRMNRRVGKSAKELLNEKDEKELVRIFSENGEVRNSKTLASAIVAERNLMKIESVDQLKNILKRYTKKGTEFKYFAQVFQALRIEVNDELNALKDFLKQCDEMISQGGRLVVISYHSLEDRLVKNYMQYGNFSGEPQKDFYGNLIRPFEPLNRKPIVPAEVEIEENNRARSAKLRIAMRIETKGNG